MAGKQERPRKHNSSPLIFKSSEMLTKKTDQTLYLLKNSKDQAWLKHAQTKLESFHLLSLSSYVHLNPECPASGAQQECTSNATSVRESLLLGSVSQIHPKQSTDAWWAPSEAVRP